MSKLEDRVADLEDQIGNLGTFTPDQVMAISGLLTEFEYLQGRVTALEQTFDKHHIVREKTRFDLAAEAKLI